MKKPDIRRLSPLPAAALCGAAIFLLIYGVRPLDVTYDAWIFNGYIETDITQRYAGWLAYRASDELLPLTFSPLLAYPYGDYTSLCDSIPLAEIFFKLLSPLLPATFQFCGLLCLVNMILQAVCGAALLRLFTDDFGKILAGGCFFCFSPVLLERMFRHTSLSFHWMILLALYLYIKGRRRPCATVTAGFTALCAASVLLHLYFTPILLGFFLACLLDGAAPSVAAKCKSALWLLPAAALCLAAAKAIGLLGLGLSNTEGYGSMGMNLNALFNPVSLDSNWWVPGCGRQSWSLFLPMRALVLNNLESFNYLGLGVLFGLCMLAASLVCRLVCSRSRASTLTALLHVCHTHLFLLLFLAFSTLFAVSNTVCAFSHVLFTIPLPQALLGLCSAFRASGRLFWGVNYTLVALVLAALCRCPRKTLSRILLAGLLVLQVADLSPALAAKHASFSSEATYYAQAQADALLAEVDRADAVLFLELREDRATGAQLLKHGIASNLLLISRGGYGVERLQADIDEMRTALLAGTDPRPGCIYVTNDAAFAEAVCLACDGLAVTEVGGDYLLAPGAAA